jgi:uncharacterized lipoprotein YmbA
MNMRYMLSILAFVCVGVATLSGCSRSPRVDFYTLSPMAKLEGAPQTQIAPTVTVAPITVPELVDRPQIVVRVDGSRVDILETERWAEPLKSGIPRLVAENLSRLLGGARVSAYPQNAANDSDYRVFVDFQRFESTGDGVTVDALWAIRRTTTGTTKTGRSQVHEPSGAGFETLVVAYNRALLSVSSEIAQAIRTDWAAAR